MAELKTIMVRQANVILEIDEADKQYYLDTGFDIIDEYGNVLVKSIPNDLRTLKAAYTEHTEEIKRLKAEIDSLRAELEAAKAAQVPATEKKARAKKESK